jgi:hypothetical protein
MQANRERAKAMPIPAQLSMLRRECQLSSKYAKVITKARYLLIAYELELGIRKPRKTWKTDCYSLPTIH